MIKLESLKSIEELAKTLESNQQYELLNLNLCDVPGALHHVDVPRTEAILTLNSRNGSNLPIFGFDASSIPGFQSIHESDMLVTPDPEATYENPFDKETLISICNVLDIDGKTYARDPRAVAIRAEEHLKSKYGNDAKAYYGPELEFFIFDGVAFDQNSHEAFYKIESEEGIWNSGKIEINGRLNLGHRPRYKGGYFPRPPVDSLRDLRKKMIKNLEKVGFHVEKGHHEVATAGQGELDYKFNKLVHACDRVLIYKDILRNTANLEGKTVTFMPKPLYGDNGSGMHTHFSIFSEEKNLFAGDKYAKLSQEALWAIGGILKHAGAVVAFTNPTSNSFRRLVPGYEAPVNLSYSKRNRSAGIRIPVYDNGADPNQRRLEFRVPDSTCNPYYAFPTILMAALDGIKNKSEPGQPMDFDQYHAPEKGKIATTPRTLDEALTALERDHEFLLEGDVFTEDIIANWIELKSVELDDLRLRPTPGEFFKYYSV